MTTISSIYGVNTQPEKQAAASLLKRLLWGGPRVTSLSRPVPFHSIQPAIYSCHLISSYLLQLFIEYLLCASSKNVPRSQEELKTGVWDFTVIEKHNVTMFLETRETRPSIRTINVNVFSSPMKPEDFQIQWTRVSRASWYVETKY